MLNLKYGNFKFSYNVRFCYPRKFSDESKTRINNVHDNNYKFIYKEKMKRIIIASLITCVALLGLTGCGEKEPDPITNPVKLYDKQVDKTREVEKELNKQTDEINELSK